LYFCTSESFDYKEYFKESAKFDFVFINYPDLLEAQNQELLKIKKEINQLEIKKEKV
jgi:lipid II:glycine glycyltransferase (peptidoglycan interpeptide bridge formation enzyme)